MSKFIKNISDRIAAHTRAFKWSSIVIADEEKLLANVNSYPLIWKWLHIPQVSCVFVDIKNSTKINLNKYKKSSAQIYEFFTGTCVDILNSLEAGYIDIKGDGVFALYSKGQHFKALCAAVTIKTFCVDHFLPALYEKYFNNKNPLELWFHIGIDCETVLVKRVGIRNDYNNEVWAWKPVNIASKLASLSNDSIWISERFYNQIKWEDKAIKSCGCTNGQQSDNYTDVWQEKNVSKIDYLDFDCAYELSSPGWCSLHGQEYCRYLYKL